MKRNQLYIAWTFVLASMMACTDNTPAIHPLDEEASRIYLSAGIGEAVSSRTPYSGSPVKDEHDNILYEVPTTSHPLDVSVWASTTSGVFPDLDLNGRNGTVAIHTQAHFQSGAPQLLGEAIYPKAAANATAKSVYFVGFHPKSKEGSLWTSSNENSVASFTFTGEEDVMFAPQIEGRYGTAYDQSPTFHFHHLLTCIRIEMIADKAEEDVEKRKDVSEAWGEIKSLTISSKQNVTVSNLSAGTFNSSNVAFDGEEVAMKLYQTGTDNVFENRMIPHEEATEVAYVMCAPVEGFAQAPGANEGEYVTVPEYTLHIKTSQRELDIPIDLKKIGDATPTYFEGSTMGHQFLVQLNFKMGNVISVSAAISLDANTDWFTHGTGSEDLEEKDFNEKN